MDYVINSSNPTREGWPAAGQPIVWRANVKNFADAPARVTYRWLEDGQEIAHGTATLAPHATTAIDLPRSWTFARHRLSFEVGGAHLEVFTDAIAAGFWVEQSLYDYFRAHQPDLGIGSICWEDWAQRQIALFNDMASMAGVLDRWRVQKIVIVPDGALPLTPVDYVPQGNEYPNAATHPDVSDRTVDLEWGFRASVISTYANTHTVSLSNPFYLAPMLLHELGHARYLIDVYGFDVQQAGGYFIDIRNDDGSPAFIQNFAYVYRTPDLGLMNRTFSFIDDYSASAMNLIAGARARAGNCNPPDDIGAFLNDLPAENAVTIVDPDGAPLADADVEIFQSQPGYADAWYATYYDNTPDLRLHSDALGRVFVGRCPFSADGTIVHGWRGSNAVAVIRAKRNGRWLYGFLEVRELNLEYWRGRTTLGEEKVVVGRASVCEMNAPLLVAPTYDANPPSADVTLQWRGIAGATAYVVHAAANGGAPQIVGSTTATSLTVHLPGRVYWWVEAQLDGCPAVRSESWRFTTPVPPWRRAAR